MISEKDHILNLLKENAMCAKSKSAYEKAAAAAKARGDKAWAKAKDPDRSDTGTQYQNARRHYDTMKRAQESAKKAKK